MPNDILRNPLLRPVSNPSDIPTEHHFAVIVFDDDYVDDGWGGNSKITVPKYYVMKDEKELIEYVSSLEVDNKQPWSRKPYAVLEVAKRVPVTIKLELG
jgi:hypothetical protein